MAQVVERTVPGIAERGPTKNSVIATSIITAHALEHMYGRGFLVLLVTRIYEVLEVWPESHWPGFALRQSDVFQSYAA